MRTARAGPRRPGRPASHESLESVLAVTVTVQRRIAGFVARRGRRRSCGMSAGIRVEECPDRCGLQCSSWSVPLASRARPGPGPRHRSSKCHGPVGEALRVSLTSQAGGRRGGGGRLGPGLSGPVSVRPRLTRDSEGRLAGESRVSLTSQARRRRRATRTRIVRPGLSQAQAARLTPTRSHESESRVSGSELCQ